MQTNETSTQAHTIHTDAAIHEMEWKEIDIISVEFTFASFKNDTGKTSHSTPILI